MSGGMHTGAPFALLDLRTKGVDMDTYDAWPELAGQALYLHAVQARGPDAAKGTQYGAPALPDGTPDSAYCDAYLARLDNLVAEVRQRVIESWDPARLRAPEVWPFCMADSTLRIHADRWYAFGDSGGTFSGHDVGHLHPDMLVGGGFASLAACRDAYEVEHGEPLTADDWSAEPEHLGGVLASILTGRQYVDRLYYLTEHDAHECTLEPYGKWSEGPPLGPRHFLLAYADEEGGYRDALSYANGADIVKWLAAEKHALPLASATARELATQVNEALFAKGAPLGSDSYFTVRELCAAVLRAETPTHFVVEAPVVQGATGEELRLAVQHALTDWTGTVMHPTRPSVVVAVNKAKVR